jgi:hypothetical protein
MAIKYCKLALPQKWTAGRDVCAALVIKGALLFALYLLCFGPAHRVLVNAQATATALLGSNPGERLR